MPTVVHVGTVAVITGGIKQVGCVTLLDRKQLISLAALVLSNVLLQMSSMSRTAPYIHSEDEDMCWGEES